MIEEHDELGAGAGRHEELYVVLTGRARFALAGEERDAPAGTVVFVRDPAVRRGAVAEEAGTTVLVVGGVPGRRSSPRPGRAGWRRTRSTRERSTAARSRSCTATSPSIPTTPTSSTTPPAWRRWPGSTPPPLEHLARAIDLNPRARGSGLSPIRTSIPSGATPASRPKPVALRDGRGLRRASARDELGLLGGARRAFAGRRLDRGRRRSEHRVPLAGNSSRCR